MQCQNLELRLYEGIISKLADAGGAVLKEGGFVEKDNGLAPRLDRSSHCNNYS